MKKWTAIWVLMGIGLTAGPGAYAQRSASRQDMMVQACAVTAETPCRSESDAALAKAQPLQLVILRGCQAEFRPAATQGAEAIDAAKDRVTACMELAVRIASTLPAPALIEGHEVVRRKPQLATQSAATFVTMVRDKLALADTKCSRIGHKYTRYNCFFKHLQALYELP